MENEMESETEKSPDTIWRDVVTNELSRMAARLENTQAAIVAESLLVILSVADLVADGSITIVGHDTDGDPLYQAVTGIG